MVLFPVVVALQNARVHISASDSGNVVTVVKRVVNESLSFRFIL